MGSVFRPKYKDKNGNYVESEVWWIKYYRNGKSFRESSGSKKKTDAERKLKSREGEVVEGRFQGLRVERITFDELAEDFLNDYKVNGKKSLDRAERSVKHLKGYFTGIRANEITTDKVKRYITIRQDEEAENGTINREMAALKRMFNLARQQTPPKVGMMPYVPHLQENNAREGYFEQDEYQALKAAVPDYFRPVVIMAYHTGMRKRELLGLKWDQVDLKGRKITLSSRDTKNSESRMIFMEGELSEAIRFQKAIRDANYPDCPWVFFGGAGEQLRDIRSPWGAGLKGAGLKGKLFHDFRRTAVRNMVRAGVPERVAMMISGHKTRSVFERYNIVNEDDLKRASRKVAEYHEQAKKPDGQSLGKVKEVTENRTEEVPFIIH